MHHILDLPVVKILFRAPAIVNQLIDGRTGSEEKFKKKPLTFSAALFIGGSQT